LLYHLLKIPARIALPFYCRKIIINDKSYLKSNGPLLLACNHPNSFLDAVILATLFDKPVYSLARGDAFNKKWAAFLLRQFNILPVYRQREGAEHLHKNYETFDACSEIFNQNGIVLIFSEALCENEWHLRPLKKGTARLAAAAWQQNIPLKILPVAVNYSNFKSFGKNIHLNFGKLIEKTPALLLNENGKILADITNSVQLQLQQLVYEIDKADKNKQAEIFIAPVSSTKKMLLALPSVAAVLLHWPLYLPVVKLVSSKAFHSVHYDSIMVGMLFILYPFYILLLCLLTYFFAGGFWWIATLFSVPFCAWSFIQLKKQTN
jgi:1-acyl-sn-glycerol-3-phosphate acyltransferase